MVRTSAPKAFEIATRSCDKPVGITTSILYPLTAATMDIAFPVLPEEASTIVSPGFKRPSFSALSIMYFAIRALIDPDGFKYSILIQIPSILINGVSPIASRMVFIEPH